MVQEPFSAFPQKIKEIIGECDILKIHVGMSSSSVYKLSSRSQRNFYLKVNPTAGQASFLDEIQRMEWLQGKLPVPEVVEYIAAEGQELMLLTEVPGITCLEAMETMPVRRIAVLLAAGLHTIHHIDITRCPFDERLSTKLLRAQHNLDHGYVDETDFDEERQGMTGKEVMNHLYRLRPVSEDLVFTHGDYCLPNVILQHGQISGYIDLGRTGVSDRYNDLAIASRSIQHNLGKSYESIFFEEYGLDKPDVDKILYYRMMDEMF